jgi:hypothetical protein
MKKSVSRSWTQDEDDKLVELIEKGLSHSRIASELGKTRNACIGRAHRLQGKGVPIEKKANPKGKAEAARHMNSVKKQKEPAKAPGPMKGTFSKFGYYVASGDSKPPREIAPEHVVEGPVVDKPIYELGACECRWPTARSPDGLQLFCSAPTGDVMRQYCAQHREISYPRKVAA